MCGHWPDAAVTPSYFVRRLFCLSKVSVIHTGTTVLFCHLDGHQNVPYARSCVSFARDYMHAPLTTTVMAAVAACTAAAAAASSGSGSKQQQRQQRQQRQKQQQQQRQQRQQQQQPS